MKKILVTILLSAIVLLLSTTALSQNCNSAPNTGYSAAGAQAYARWCSDCGGRPTGNFSCNQGSHWGRRDSGGSSSSYDSGAAAAAAEAERQRQAEAERKRQQDEIRRQEEERQKREAEERQRKQEEFERNKAQALHDLKGTAGELGLKGLDTDSGFGLKDVSGGTTGLHERSGPADCTWGDQPASVVDLRCLGIDPDKPIVIDPHVVRGQQRVFPAQIDPATFQNANYNKGFEALMRPGFHPQDAADAIAFFKAAQAQRPNDPMVRNGLALAQDILKARQQKEINDQVQAEQLVRKAYAGLIVGDTSSARAFIAQARALEPHDAQLRFADTLISIAAPESTSASTPERRAAYKIVANSVVAINEQNDSAAVAMLQAAHRLQPEDKFIQSLLLTMRNYEAGRASANPPPRSATSPQARPQNQLPTGPQQ
jgi:hypothetical protein